MWPLRRRPSPVGYARQNGHTAEIDVRGMDPDKLDELKRTFQGIPELASTVYLHADGSRLTLLLNPEIVMPSTTRGDIADIYQQKLKRELRFTDDPRPRLASSRGWRWRWSWRTGGDVADDATEGFFS